MIKKNLYISRNLNINAILEKHSPKIKNFRVDRLLLIIHLLNALPARSKRIADMVKKNDGFVPLKAERLRKEGIHNYNQYFKYLTDRGVIESDNSFVRGKKARWYRFTAKYRQKVIKVVVTKKMKGSMETFLSMHRLKKKYPFLRWFDIGKLEIDMPKATEYLEDTYDQADDILKFNYNYIACSQIDSMDFHYTADNTSQRLHTNLTSLKKELKPYITFDGSQLVGVDVKNAQPFFSTVVLSKEFFYSEDKFSIGKIFGKETDKKETREAIQAMQGKGRETTITLLKSFGEAERQNIRWFIQLVSTGSVYEAFMLKYRELWGKSIDRDKAKKRFIKQLFAEQKHYIRERAVFIALFPTVYRVFMTLTDGHRNGLAILLQRIESYLILEKVCKQISKERPDLPIFTIHDNVATLKGSEDYVATVIKSILREYIGYEPEVGIEPWQEDNPMNEDRAS